jgi:hypothetical protein
MHSTASERELPLMAAIGGLFRWLEELLTLLSGPLLTAGLGLALVDLLTDGKLLATQPELLFAWAIAMALGLDAQLVGAAVKLGRALRTARYWAAFAYLVLVAALSYVAFLAAQVFATQEAHGWTTAQALSALGMDGTTWLIQRSALSVALVVLSGLLRYTPPRAATIADEQAKLERELALEPLRQQVRAGRALGYVQLARNATLAITGKAPAEPPVAPPTGLYGPASVPTEAETPTRPPTGPGAPSAVSKRKRKATTQKRPTLLRLPAPAERVHAALASEPELSIRALARAAGVSHSTASKWRKVHQAQEGAQAQ